MIQSLIPHPFVAVLDTGPLCRLHREARGGPRLRVPLILRRDCLVVNLQGSAKRPARTGIPRRRSGRRKSRGTARRWQGNTLCVAVRQLILFHIPARPGRMHLGAGAYVSLALSRQGPREGYSLRSAIIGSTRVALRAGMKQASSATAESTSATAANVTGSVAVTP